MKSAWVALVILFSSGGRLDADVTKDDIKELLRVGTREPDIRAYVEAHRPLLPLSAEDLADLKGAGASEALLQFLVTPSGVPAVPPVAEGAQPSVPPSAVPEVPGGAYDPYTDPTYAYYYAYPYSYYYPYSYPYYYRYCWYPWSVWFPPVIVPFHRHLLLNSPKPILHQVPPPRVVVPPPHVRSPVPAPLPAPMPRGSSHGMGHR